MHSRTSGHRESKDARTLQPWQGRNGAPEGRLDYEGGGCQPPAPSPFQLRKLAGTQKHARFPNLQDKPILQSLFSCIVMVSLEMTTDRDHPQAGNRS